MHDGMPYGRNQGQGHSREVDRQSPTGLIFSYCDNVRCFYSNCGDNVCVRSGSQLKADIKRSKFSMEDSDSSSEDENNKEQKSDSSLSEDDADEDDDSDDDDDDDLDDSDSDRNPFAKGSDSDDGIDFVH